MNQKRLLEACSAFAIAFSLLIGIYARFVGNGVWPFSGDEYLIAQSVRNILSYGIPAFDCGGLYVRGIFLQYFLAAFSYFSGAPEETAYRSVIAVTNLLAIPALFLLAKRISGILVAIGVIVFFCLSLWEIELSRYARFYVPFQTLFIWYVYVFYLVAMDKKTHLLPVLWVLSLFTMFVYEGGIFLCLLNFLPTLIDKNNISLKSLIMPLAVILMAASYFSVDWRGVGAEPRYPAGYEFQSQLKTNDDTANPIPSMIGPATVPNKLLGLYVFDSPWGYAFFAIILVSIIILYRTVFLSRASFFEQCIVSLLLVFSLLNQLTLLALVVGVSWLFGFVSVGNYSRRQLIEFSLLIMAIFSFWLLFGLNTVSWHGLFDVAVSEPVSKLLVVLLKYPDIYTKVVTPWVDGQPLTTVAYTAVISAGLLIACLKREISAEEKLLYGIMLFLFALVAILRQPYTLSKYTFFLYPLVILAALSSLQRIVSYVGFKSLMANRFAFVSLCGVLMIACEDFGLQHIRTIDSFETNFRMGYSRGRERHLWRKFDSRSAANFVNQQTNPTDKIVSTVRPVDFYLDRLDYFYFDEAVPEIIGVSACEGKKENWTSANLIYNERSLEQFLDNRTSRIWLIAYNSDNQRARNSDKYIAETYVDQHVFSSLDDSVKVYLLKDLASP